MAEGTALKDEEERPAGIEHPVEDLFRREYPALVRFGVALTGARDVGEEVAQEAFVAMWTSMDRLRDPAAAPAYLRRTALNIVRRRAQRSLLERRHLRTIPEGIEDPDHAARLTLVEAMQRLPLRQRACVTLRYYEDLTEEQTAAVLGVSVGTVKSQTHKALRRLRTIVEGLS